MGDMEKLHIKPAVVDKCDVHERPTDGLAKWLVAEMRKRHGKGGVNVCRECVERAVRDAKEKRR